MLLSMVNDILDFYQIQKGKLRLNFSSFDLRLTIEEIKFIFTRQA